MAVGPSMEIAVLHSAETRILLVQRNEGWALAVAALDFTTGLAISSFESPYGQISTGC